MNSKIKFLFLFLIISLVFSCSQDEGESPMEEDDPPQQSQAQLKRVKTWSLNQPLFEYVFNEDRLVAIEDNGIVLFTISYENGLIRRWEGNSGVFREFTYDNQGRIVSISTSNKSGTEIRAEHELTYVAGKIESLYKLNSGNGNIQERRSDLILDSNNRIIQEVTLPVDGPPVVASTVTYVGQDLTQLVTPFVTYDYSYMDVPPQTVYSFYPYLFGDHWRNNVILELRNFGNSTFLTPNFSASVLTNKYLSFQEITNSAGTSTYESTYDFDDDGNLIRHTKNRTSPDPIEYEKAEYVYE